MSRKWQLKRSIEKRYARAIEKLMRMLWDSLKGTTNPFNIRTLVESFVRTPAFRKAANNIAVAMALAPVIASAKLALCSDENRQG